MLNVKEQIRGAARMNGYEGVVPTPEVLLSEGVEYAGKRLLRGSPSQVFSQEDFVELLFLTGIVENPEEGSRFCREVSEGYRIESERENSSLYFQRVNIGDGKEGIRVEYESF